MRVPATLVPDWRAEAERLEAWGAAAQAATLRHAADELEATLRNQSNDVLTLAHAAHESGFSRDHLARLVRAGKIPNRGRPHAPRIARGDLPRKLQALPPALGTGTVADARRRMAATVVHSRPGE